MRMKRLRALIAAAPRRLSAQHICQLQHAARRLAGTEPDYARTQPLAGIVERQGKGRLLNASGHRRQRALFFSADVAEKRQRQMQVIGGDRPSGIVGKMGSAPVNNLFLYRFWQFKSEKQPFRLGHDRDSVMNYGDATMLALEC